jgi:hypothetical protein
VLSLLVNNPAEFSAAPSQASLFRVVGHTQLLDEVDSWTNQEELRDLLNAGFRKGRKVQRVEKPDKRNFGCILADYSSICRGNALRLW